jgi:hypothetical protein
MFKPVGIFFSLMVADGGAIRPLTGAQSTNFIIGGYEKSGDTHGIHVLYIYLHLGDF